MVPAAAVLTACAAVMILSRPYAAAEPFVAPGSLLPAGEVVFEFHDPVSGRRRPMRVFAYFPEAARGGDPTNVLFVLHGVSRNAEDYFRRIVPAEPASPLGERKVLPEEHNFVLLVPEFSTELFPERSAYNWGNVFQVRRLPSMHALQEDAAFSCLFLSPPRTHLPGYSRARFILALPLLLSFNLAEKRQAMMMMTPFICRLNSRAGVRASPVHMRVHVRVRVRSSAG